MGSPNFKTNSKNPSFAIADSCECAADQGYCDCGAGFDLLEKLEAAGNFANTMNTSALFATVKVELGYESGFQIIVEPLDLSANDYAEMANEVEIQFLFSGRFEVMDKDGFLSELSEQPLAIQRYYAKKIAGNWSKTTFSFMNKAKVAEWLEGIATAETERFNKEAKEFAINQGLGLIEGSAWTSRVNYNWQTA